MIAEMVGLMLFPAMMAFAASSDLLTMTISNRVSLILIAGFFVLASASGMSAVAVLWHVIAACTVLAATFGFFSRGWIGGGDAKLAATIALWLGFDHLLPYLVLASLFGGALTLAVIWFRMSPLPDIFAKQDWVQRLHRNDSGIPYGIAIAAAALAVYPQTAWVSSVGA
jgi:prepilin peptidase CpaA